VSGGRLGAVTAAAVLASALATGCAERPPERPQWNLVVLLVDTLRADHLGAYGYPRPTSPALDAFAAANVRFASHRSQAPCTFPSVNSILTSRSPQRFTGRAMGVYDIPDGIPTLAGILDEHGYATLGVSASPIVRATPSHLNKVGGFGGGFDLFLERCMGKRAACVHTDAFTYLPLVRRPFFLYLHYMDVHAPYDPPDWYEKRFFTDYRGGKKWVRQGDPNPIKELVYSDRAADRVDRRDLDGLVDLYDDSIGFLDQQLALLLATLEEAGELDRTLIAVLADHGESFLEKGHVLHCRSLYEAEVRVPWLMRVPELDGPVEIAGPTANLDVTPTLLDLLGIDPAPYAFEGRSLRPAIEDREPVEGPVFAVWGGLRSATDGRHKLIANVDHRLFELYDLEADPGEETDLAEREPGVVRRLAREISGWMRRVEGTRATDPEGETLEQQLEALGYL
jgi:arylsulfatase A-like enzyme